jgi:carbamate kinase
VRLVVALGGNALLRRGEALSPAVQQRNVAVAARALAPLAGDHDLVLTHGNGPQVGLLAMQAAADDPDRAFPLDVLDAETEGMIGYLVERELAPLLPAGRRCAALLTQVEVDPADPAFRAPDKFIGPTYGRDQALALARRRGWSVAPDGAFHRRVVASPHPLRVLELNVIEALLAMGVVVICAGGGGIPVVRRTDGSLVGVEAVVDKDRVSALLARALGADALLLLTDVPAVYHDLDAAPGGAIRQAPPQALGALSFPAGSMGPKVEAACAFADGGGFAAIGALEDAAALLAGAAGTRVTRDATGIDDWSREPRARR